MIDLLGPDEWQMTTGERAVLEGVLAQLNPQLSIEVGTAEGGSLRRIAAHSGRVHSFDLVRPKPAVEALENVTLHTGDSHVLLAEFLIELERTETNVDFALVDGDHTADGVRQDLDALLSSPAVGCTAILIHDTANEVVREGLQRVRYDEYPHVTYLDLDFIAGHLSLRGPFHHQLWGGIGLVMVDRATTRERAEQPESGFYSSYELFAAIRDGLVDAEREGRPVLPRRVINDHSRGEREAALAVDLERARSALNGITSSASWRFTAPLRTLKSSLQARRRS